MSLSGLKRLVLAAFFGRWRSPRQSVDGYTILLPSPTDMPFLLRFALEALQHLNTSHCRQIIVIPDGYGTDQATALQQVVDCCGDSRVEMAQLSKAAHFIVHGMHRSGGEIANWTHWAMIVEGINRAKCDYIFLHDADAVILERDGIERQYRECHDHEMATLGVMARWDSFFREIGYTIPGTYELMFSARWARCHSPLDLKGGLRRTTFGTHMFDTMLYPQFQDYHSGKIGIIDPAPQLVHFSGAITKYRMFCDRVKQPLVDEDFRLLFLSLMEELFPSPNGDRLLRSTSLLAQGLVDPSAAVTYESPRAVLEYHNFRAMIDDLCRSPIFQGPRAEKVRSSVLPFDRHYKHRFAAAISTDSQPSGNAVTINHLETELADKQLKFLTEIVPGLSHLAVLLNPSNPDHGRLGEQLRSAAQCLSIELVVAQAPSPDKFESAFATVIAGRAAALIVLADEMLFDNLPRILAFTEVCRLPALFSKKEIARIGGLLGYGPSFPTNPIRGVDRAGLPIELPRLELAINLTTAKSLGITIPSTLIDIADEVFE
jgi:ABC transporter substrate binding protein